MKKKPPMIIYLFVPVETVNVIVSYSLAFSWCLGVSLLTNRSLCAHVCGRADTTQHIA